MDHLLHHLDEAVARIRKVVHREAVIALRLALLVAGLNGPTSDRCEAEGLAERLQRVLGCVRQGLRHGLVLSEVEGIRHELETVLESLEKEMLEAVKKLEFEKAALLRDQISFLQGNHASLHKKTISKGPNRKRYGRRHKKQ